MSRWAALADAAPGSDADGRARRAAGLVRAGRLARIPVAVRVFSDLHQDVPGNSWDPWATPVDELRRDAPHPPTADIVVVAGDVHAPGTAAIDWLADRLVGFEVVYVAGNHDLWWNGGDDRYTYLDMVDRMREAGYRRGVHVLVDSEVVLRDIRFVGGTLWTDMRLGTASRAEAYATARRGMNDYRRIRRRPSGRHRHLRPEETHATHRATVEYLDAAMAVPHDGPTVVVTHHAPSPRSLDDEDMALRHCYASDLEWVMARHDPALWVHGHLHNHSDYMVGRTRVVANPRGHRDELATSGFVQDLVVHV